MWTPGRKISPQAGFDPRTVHSVASRYTDYAIPGGTQYNMLTFKTVMQYSNPLLSILLAAQFKYVDFTFKIHAAKHVNRQTLSNTRFWQQDHDNASGLWWSSASAILLQE
jgi:hypothetical protein